MHSWKKSSLGKFLGTAAVAGAGIYLATTGALSQQTPPAPLTRFAGPTSSQPLALDGNGTWLVVANPDSNSVTFFDVTGDRNRLLREVQVGREPNGVAVNPLGTRAYVANTVSGTVSVLNLSRTGGQQIARVMQEIKVGTEPYGLAMTPNGTKLYVTNRRSNSVSVIDTASNRVITTIPDVGPAPTGIAITNNGDDRDDDELVYVTQFYALPRPGRLDGEDDSKQGVVTVIPTVSDQVDHTVNLLPIGDTGFKAAGDAIAKVAPPATITAADLRFTTSAYPNQLNNLAIKGNFVYLPTTGASPNGPIRFDVNTQSLLCVIDRAAKTDANQTLNMHTAVRDQADPAKLFITQPWAIAAKNSADEAYVISMASDIVVKLVLDRGTGAARVQNNGATPTHVLEIPTGKNPRGIVINNTDSRAYVMNLVSRDVTVINIQSGQDRVIGTMRSTALPTPGSIDDMILAGKELYHSSVGTFDGPGIGSPAITGRMSNNGWGSCGACHPDGLTDNVVWIFGAGPRRTISQHQDFDADDPTSMRALNWSGIFDELEDFEANIRGTSGGLGLIVADDGTTQLNPINPFANSSGDPNRRQLRIRGFRAWDAIKAYVQFGIRSPLSPIDKNDADTVAGQQLFIQSNCQSCHGGNQWTVSRVNFAPPPPASVLSANGAEIIGELKKVGTFDPTQKNEIRATAVAPLGADGFVPPSLLGISAFPQTFFHNGSANSLDDVMANVAHRTAGTGGADFLSDDNSRRQIIQFIKSIDSSTQPIPSQ